MLVLRRGQSYDSVVAEVGLATPASPSMRTPSPSRSRMASGRLDLDSATTAGCGPRSSVDASSRSSVGFIAAEVSYYHGGSGRTHGPKVAAATPASSRSMTAETIDFDSRWEAAKRGMSANAKISSVAVDPRQPKRAGWFLLVGGFLLLVGRIVCARTCGQAMTEKRTKSGYPLGMITGLLVVGFALVLGAMGVGSDRFPADVSIRAQSTQSGRIYGARGRVEASKVDLASSSCLCSLWPRQSRLRTDRRHARHVPARILGDGLLHRHRCLLGCDGTGRVARSVCARLADHLFVRPSLLALVGSPGTALVRRLCREPAGLHRGPRPRECGHRCARGLEVILLRIVESGRRFDSPSPEYRGRLRRALLGSILFRWCCSLTWALSVPRHCSDS